MDDVWNTVANEPGRLISRLPELQRKTEGPETTINKHEALLMKENKGHELKSNGDSDLESRRTLGTVRWSQEGEDWSPVGSAPHQPPRHRQGEQGGVQGGGTVPASTIKLALKAPTQRPRLSWVFKGARAPNGLGFGARLLRAQSLSPVWPWASDLTSLMSHWCSSHHWTALS